MTLGCAYAGLYTPLPAQGQTPGRGRGRWGPKPTHNQHAPSHECIRHSARPGRAWECILLHPRTSPCMAGWCGLGGVCCSGTSHGFRAPLLQVVATFVVGVPSWTRPETRDRAVGSLRRVTSPSLPRSGYWVPVVDVPASPVPLTMRTGPDTLSIRTCPDSVIELAGVPMLYDSASNQRLPCLYICPGTRLAASTLS